MAKRVGLGRHKRRCSICTNPKRAEIEADFISWRSPAAEAIGEAEEQVVFQNARWERVRIVEGRG
jgi:DUF971 family protein